VANSRGGSLRCGVVIQMPLPRMTDVEMLAWRLRETIEYYARLAEKAAQKRSGPRSGRHPGGDGFLRVATRKPGQSGLVPNCRSSSTQPRPGPLPMVAAL
jgi:hypothetical protein